jgi:hypothetical protein
VHFTAHKHAATIPLQAGDLRFINNLAVLHCRDAFEDGEGEGEGGQQRRHLVRLWLRSPQRGWDMPPKLRMAWDRVYADLPGEPEEWQLDPELTAERVVQRQSSCGQG